jgi:predicted nucleic acid-binding protein
VAAALAAKVRAGFLSESLKEEILLLYARTARQSFSPLDVRVQDFDQAMGLASETAAGVRGGDALHLAIAMRHGATLCTLDARQAEAAGVLGIDAKLV